MLDRRALLLGGGALALAAVAPPVPALRAALDAAAAERDPARALRLLTGFDPAALSGADRLDLATARAGLAVDVEIAALGLDPRGKGPFPHDRRLPPLLLRRKLGDGIDAGAAARRLERERRTCAARADRLFRTLGIAGHDTGARFSMLWRHDAYPNDDGGRLQAIGDMNLWLARFVRRAPALIGRVPEWCLDVSANAAGAPGTRALPEPGKPGGYTPDLARVADRPRWTLPSVVAHELIPGHMVQLPIETYFAPHPLRLTYAPAFAEGWAIHAEKLVADDGAYAADPHAELGYLHWRLFRIGRALVDLAIHLGALPTETARARLVAWQGEPAYFAPFDGDLARIVAEPMTRAAEMLAALALEDGARGRQGAALVRYHQRVLADGRVRSDELARTARATR